MKKIIVPVLFLLSGCVSTKTYRHTLAQSKLNEQKEFQAGYNKGADDTVKLFKTNCVISKGPNQVYIPCEWMDQISFKENSK